MSDKKQIILKLTDQEMSVLSEIVNYIRKIRDYETDKDHKSMIGRINVKVYNEMLEVESINFKTTSYK